MNLFGPSYSLPTELVPLRVWNFSSHFCTQRYILIATTPAPHSENPGYDSQHEGLLLWLTCFVLACYSAGSCCDSTWTASTHHINLLFTDIHPVNAIYSLEDASLKKLSILWQHLWCKRNTSRHSELLKHCDWSVSHWENLLHNTAGELELTVVL